MIQLLNPLDIQTLHKTLPKKLSHIKEHAKVMFINQAIKDYKNFDNFGPIDFVNSVYDGNNVNIIFREVRKKISMEQLIHSILEKWYFGNLEKNENVYFYRFVNLVRANVGVDEWNVIHNFLINSENLTLKENYKQYVDYRKKLDEIDFILSQEIFTAKEFV
jgi:hypothetical protein